MSTAQGHLYESHPSVTASMEDFEARGFSPDIMTGTPLGSAIKFRSPVASVFSDDTDPLHGGWSPPAWRKAGTGWYQHDHLQSGLPSPRRSREPSPLVHHHHHHHHSDDHNVDDDIDASDIPLPESKGPSPERSLSPEIRRPGYTPSIDERLTPFHDGSKKIERTDNYIRFSVRADMQHRTEPIEAVVTYIRKTHAQLTKSRYTTFMSIVTALFAITLFRTLLQEPISGPTPDLIKLAGFTKSFEPLVYYSENGHSQVVQLGETGVAVWDLGESVRSTNMTSGPIIVRELDELSESLKSLANELTRFFANVDGDVDSILLVMEWAQRELTKIATIPQSQLSLAFSNLHDMLSRVGILENRRTGEVTILGQIVSELFGKTKPQVTRAALQRTFHDFLNVLEESINNELVASQSLFAHFEAIDRQFLNLQRTVIRETDAQEREEGEMLASLWSRVIGANASRLKKFEKNKQLLSSLRERTVGNKHTLVDHNSRLMQLRSNLEILRKKLVSPLVRANDSSSLTIEEQIHGLEGTYMSLRARREGQKSRLLEEFHEAGARRMGIVREDGYAIEGR